MGYKTIQEEVKEAICDKCRKKVEGHPIRVDSYCCSSYEENYLFCSIKCLVSWLASPDGPSSFSKRFVDFYDYLLSMNGKHMAEFADWVREKAERR